jgi:hypothetical protein
MSQFVIKKATKYQAKGRIGFVGPAGSGKTYTSLIFATSLGTKICLIDSENLSSEKYADKFDFDVLPLDPPYSPERYTQAIKFADEQGYDVVVIDSLSHAWAGEGGALEMVDNNKARYKGNSYAAWRDVTPQHNKLIDTILRANAHVIACMRAKTDYVQEKDAKGNTVIRKVGMAPVQREGMDYEFDIVFDLDWDHRGIVTKSRFDEIADQVFMKPGKEVAEKIAGWLNSGEAAPERPVRPEPEVERTQASLVQWAKDNYNLDGKGVGAALKKAGIQKFEAERWDEMQEAIKAHAEFPNEVDPEPVMSGNGTQPA